LILDQDGLIKSLKKAEGKAAHQTGPGRNYAACKMGETVAMSQPKPPHYTLEVDVKPDEIILSAYAEDHEGGAEIGMSYSDAVIVGLKLLAAAGYSTELLVQSLNQTMVMRA